MHALKNRPEDFALLAADSRLAAKARDVAIGVPGFQLPGVGDVRPFAEKEMRREFMAADILGCLGYQRPDQRGGGNLWLPEALRIKIIADSRDWLHGDARRNGGLGSDKACQFDAQCVGKRLRERRQQHVSLRIRSCQMNGAVQRDDGLARACRPRNPRGAGEGALDQRALRRVQKHRPLVPRVVEGAAQLFDIGQHAEAALRVGMREGVGFYGGRRGRLGRLADGEFQQRLLRFLRQVRDDVEQRVLGRSAHIVDPLLGHAERHQFVFAQIVEEADARTRLGRSFGRGGGVLRLEDFDFFDALADFDKLHGAGRRVPLDLAALGPFVGGVMMIDVGEQQARRGTMHDQPDVGVHPHRPEIRVLGAIADASTGAA